jgi:hypothetical protein
VTSAHMQVWTPLYSPKRISIKSILEMWRVAAVRFYKFP